MDRKIAFLSSHGPKWMAGVIYIQNFLGAFSLLPDEERPPFCLLLGVKAKKSHFSKDMGPFLPAVYHFTHRKDHRPRQKVSAALFGAARLQRPISLERLVSRVYASVVFPANFPGDRPFPAARIGWIPDFQHRRLPSYFSAQELVERDSLFRRRIFESAHIVVSSRDAYDDLMRFFPTDPGRVSVLSFVNFPFPGWFEASGADAVKRFDLPARYLIFPAQFWRHKNHRLLFEAVRMLRDMGLDDVALVCTGYTRDYRHPQYAGELREWLVRHDLHTRVRILGLLPRAHQIQLMRSAAAVVQPSLFEGWSAIVEDAQALGKRIYLSDIPVHLEQDPPDAVYFDPHDAAGLAGCIKTDWTHLAPGPDRKREQAAKKRQLHRALAFARRFLAILDKQGV